MPILLIFKENLNFLAGLFSGQTRVFSFRVIAYILKKLSLGKPLASKDKLLTNAQKFLSKGQIPKAIGEYRKLVNAYPGDVRNRQKLAELLSRDKRSEEAVQEYETVAKYYSDSGFYLKAIAVFKQMQKIEPSRIDIYHQLAELNEKQGLIGNALSEYRNLVSFYETKEMFEEAIQVLGKMAELDPGNLNVLAKTIECHDALGLEEHALDKFNELVEFLAKGNDHIKIIKVYEHFLHICPEGNICQLPLAEALINTGSTQQAVSILKNILKHSPDDLAINRCLAQAYVTEQDFHNAHLTLKHLLKSHDDIDLREYCLKVCIDFGELVHARNYLEEWKDSFLEAGRKDVLNTFCSELDFSQLGDSLEETSTAGECEVSDDGVDSGHDQFPVEQELGAHDSAQSAQSQVVEEKHDEETALHEVDQDVATESNDFVSEQSKEPESQQHGLESLDIKTSTQKEIADNDVEASPSEGHFPVDEKDYVEVEVEIDPDGMGELELEFDQEVFSEPIEDDDNFPRTPTQVTSLPPEELLSVEPPNAIETLSELDVVEEVDTLEEIEELDAPEELGETEELVEIEELAENEYLGEIEEQAEIEGLGETEELVEIEELAENEYFGEIEELAENGELGDIEELGETDELLDIEELDMQDALKLLDPEKSATGLPQAGESGLQPEIASELEEVEFYFQQGLYDEATKVVSTLLESYPEHPFLIAKLDEINRSLQAAEEASSEAGIVDLMADLRDDDLLAAADFLDPFSPETSEQEQLSQKTVSEIDSSDTESHFNLGIAYKEMGLYDDAIAEFEKASQDPERLIDCVILTGQCQAESGATDPAMKTFRDGLTQKNLTAVGRMTLNFELGLIYLMKGQSLEALESFQLVAEQDSFFRNVSDLIKDLRRELGIADSDDDGPLGDRDRVSYL